MKSFSIASPQNVLFILHSALLLLGIGVAQPLSTFLSFRAWRWFLGLSVLSHGYKVRVSASAPVTNDYGNICVHVTSLETPKMGHMLAV